MNPYKIYDSCRWILKATSIVLNILQKVLALKHRGHCACSLYPIRHLTLETRSSSTLTTIHTLNIET